MPKRHFPQQSVEFVYHVINRGAKRSQLFETAGDYLAFELMMDEAKRRTGMRILAYCLMPNHWHFVLWPRTTAQLSEFMHWLTVTHAHRWQSFHHTVGTGAVYQGRYKAIPIQTNMHFVNVCRYVERNPLRATLVSRAQDWRWSSLWLRQNTESDILDTWPCPVPEKWTELVNTLPPQDELDQVRRAVSRGLPLGEDKWIEETAKIMGIESKLRPRGRPKKDPGSLLQ